MMRSMAVAGNVVTAALILLRPGLTRAQEEGCPQPAGHTLGSKIAAIPTHIRNHFPPHVKLCHDVKNCVVHPGEMPNFGYVPNCWTPWPAPADWSHCRCAPTSVRPPIVQFGSPPPVPQTEEQKAREKELSDQENEREKAESRSKLKNGEKSPDPDSKEKSPDKIDLPQLPKKIEKLPGTDPAGKAPIDGR